MILKYLGMLAMVTSSLLHASQWPHLSLPEFKARQAKAAEWVRDCTTILEIGGGQHPITQFALPAQKVIVIDPAIKRKEEENIYHIPQAFEKWIKVAGSTGPEGLGTNYAVILLGLQLVMPDNAWPKLVNLIDNSTKTVIEYSLENADAKKQVKQIQRDTHKRIVQELELDLSAKTVYKGKKVFGNRKMVLFAAKE